MSSNKSPKGIPVASKIPTSGRDSGTHSRSSSVSNLTSASDMHSEAGEAASDSALNFKLNDKVWVNGTKPGCIKFIGKTQFAPGLWVGILLDKAEGKNDGTVSGIKYFASEPLRGIFARPQKLTRSFVSAPAASDAASGGVAGAPKNPGFSTPAGRGLTASNLSLCSAKGVCSRLRVGERVVASSTTGVKNGILRFLGETDFAKGEWAGIELDEAVGKNDGSVAGKRYFNCPMKYGLFAPVHKVSRAGGTATPRTPSVRGTPLMRATSRDSLSSSVSTSSKASRVKLGVTSLTNSQQKVRSTGGVGIMTTSRALEEALKEKDQHIEQLLKEHDMERAELANTTSRCEEAENKYFGLLEKFETFESERRDFEEQIISDRRKLEDLQFQLEEEIVTRSDLETQLQKDSKIFQRLESFLRDRTESHFLNVQEIMDGKEILSPAAEEQQDDLQNSQITAYKKNISSLEIELKEISEEKCSAVKDCEELKVSLHEANQMHEKRVAALNSSNQEKDEVISSLKSELSAQVERLTKIIEENNMLTEQMELQAATTQGDTDSMVHEFGEKIKSLTEEIKSKCTLLEDYEISCKEKEIQLSKLQDELVVQAELISKTQQSNESLIQDLKEKTNEVNGKISLQNELQEELKNMKSQTEYEASQKDEKILALVKDIEHLTNSLQEKEDSIAQNGNAISESSKRIEELTQCNLEIQEKLKIAEENTNSLSTENSEKVSALQKQIEVLVDEKETIARTYAEKKETLQAHISRFTRNLEKKNSLLLEKEFQISSVSEILLLKEAESSALKKELIELQEKFKNLEREAEDNLNGLKMKEELLMNVQRKLADAENSITEKNKNIQESEKEKEALESVLRQVEEEKAQLLSKLEIAEQKVEMLNKDSSEHVMTLQEQLSTLKEESVKAVTLLEQKLVEREKDNEKLSTDVVERNNSLEEKAKVLSDVEEKLKATEETANTLTNHVQKLEESMAELIKAKDAAEMSHEEQRLVQGQEFDSGMQKKDKEIADLTEENKKLNDQLQEKLSGLTERDESMKNLETLLQEKQNEISKLVDEVDKSKQEVTTQMNSAQELKSCYEKELASKLSLESQLNKLEETVKVSQLNASESGVLIESNKKELQQKESECESLRNALQNKESQFEELSQLVEASQAQLLKLGEQNVDNVKLLESKESYFSNFKAEKEQQLIEVEKRLKDENASLQDSLEQSRSCVKEKDELVSRLNAEAEEQNAHLVRLQDELNTSRALSQKSVQDTDEAQKGFAQRISELETKYSQLLEEKKKIEDEEQKAKGAQKNLEEVRDSLLQEKVQREEVVKDKEASLALLQQEVERMQAEFMLHKQELQQKLDVSEAELQAARELKIQLELQHSVLEELQQELQNSEDKRTGLEAQVQNMAALSSEKTELINKLAEYENKNKEKSDKIASMREEYQALQELFQSDQSTLMEKEAECSTLKEKLNLFISEEESKENIKSALKSVEKENKALKQKIETLESNQVVKNVNETVAVSNNNRTDSDERESLLSQVDFLNSIIVDMKQKNEKLQQEVEIFKMGPGLLDANLNDTPKKPAPRLFCDICDVFDLHDTDDCPKQESYVEDEGTPELIPQGARKLAERPYCNNCEVFGHWTLECEEQETY